MSEKRTAKKSITVWDVLLIVLGVGLALVWLCSMCSIHFSGPHELELRFGRFAGSSEPIYEGQQLSSLVKRALLKSDYKAGQVLKRTIVSVDNSERMLIEKRLAVCAIKALSTPGYPGLRKAYSFLLSHCPAPVCKMLPVWRMPSAQDGSCALLWIWSWPLDPVYPQSLEPYQQLQPILCKIAGASSTTMPDRQLAVRALTHFNTFSPEICQVMLGALSNHADRIEQFVSKDVIQWCGKFTPAPERAVPVLVEGLVVDDNSLIDPETASRMGIN